MRSGLSGIAVTAQIVSPGGIQADQYYVANSRYVREFLSNKPDARSCQENGCHGQKHNATSLFCVQSAPDYLQCLMIDVDHLAGIGEVRGAL